jgi:LysR family transcriptional repressor of citA
VDLRTLRTFQVAARHLNLHQAAQALYLSQPTVSKHIQQLENELNCNLFERWGRSLRLTPAGERFLFYANKLLEQADAMLQEFTAWQAGREERLTVAASPMVARSVLPWILRTYRARIPNVDTIISILLSEEIPPAVANGDAEAGLSRIKPEDPRLTGILLYDDPVIFVAPALGLANLQLERPADYRAGDWRVAIQRYPLITHNHPGYWDDLLLAVRQEVANIRTMVVTQVDITKRLIEEGLGVSFLPRSAVHRELNENRLLQLAVPQLELPVAASWLVFRNDQPLSPAARAFVDLAKELQSALREPDKLEEIMG